MAQPEEFTNVLNNQPTALTNAVNSTFGAAGANHSVGLVPDPGNTTHSPAWLLGDDATFHDPTAVGFPTPTRAGDLIYWNGSAWVTLAGNNSSTLILQESSVGAPSWVSWSSFLSLLTQPTYTSLITGTALTYTPPAGIVRIKVRMCGGGGGGGALATNNGTNGTDSAFGTWTAKGGIAGTAAGGVGGAGGTGGTDGTGTKIIRFPGGEGGDGNNQTATSSIGTPGGSNPFGGCGAAKHNLRTGGNAATNTGGGGSGAGENNGVTGATGGGGGAGEYVEFTMTAAQVGASVTYTVGPGGPGGAAGSVAGGNGAAGVILIEEFYY
jgi:hypothetical protein